MQKSIAIQKCILLILLTFAVALAEAANNEKLVLSGMGYGSQYVLEEAYRRLGRDIEIQVLPGERSIQLANDGKVDGEMIRIKDIHHSYTNLIMVPVPVFYIDLVVFSRTIDFPVNSWESLQPYRIGVQRGMKIVEERTAGMDVERLDSLEQIYKMVLHDRVDVGVLGRVDVLMAKNRPEFSAIKILEPPLNRLNLYHYLHKKHRDVLPEITKILSEMEQQGEIERLVTKMKDELTR